MADYGSFKDFIESTGDAELLDLYVEGLELKNFSKLEKRLKEKGYIRIKSQKIPKDLSYMKGYLD